MIAAVDSIKWLLSSSGYYRTRLGRRGLPGVAVLSYHSVRADDDKEAAELPYANLHVTVSTLRSHLRSIRKNVNPISLDQWRRALRGEGSLPRCPLLVTFDDGYRSVAKLALPLLQHYEIPAVVFACSGPMEEGTLLWYDALARQEGEARVESSKRDAGRYAEESVRFAHTPSPPNDPLQPMSPPELRLLVESGLVEIGSHTVSHPILSQLDVEAQRRELLESKQKLEGWTGKAVRALAYPNGIPGVDYTEETLRLVEEVGYDMAFTTRPTFARPDESSLERSRFVIVNEVTGVELVHRLAMSWS